MKLWDIIKSDLKARQQTETIKGFLKSYFSIHDGIFKLQTWIRINMWLREHKFIKLLFHVPVHFIYTHYVNKYHVHIGVNHIGKGLYIVHGDNLYLNCEHIGDNFKVYQGVTLGVDEKGGRPYVHNNVTCYTNAVVIGNIELYDNCRIGALAFVNKSVKPYTLVGGVPAREIKKLEH